ncbi:MAG: DUF3048 domain-containing protein [Bacillota bacterium]|nr:DUF3048 domain-containing protein [Bacillota bacterium]
MATSRRKPGKSKLPVVVVIIAVVVVLAAAGFFVFAGGAGGKLADFGAKEQYVSPLTGQVYDEELPARPLIVSIDNVGDAIPQSWLSKTDLVYEFPVEGEQTRLQAIYYGQFPEEFGPIRSTRPYFVDLTREYKGVFLAHGWSPQAKEYLMSDVVPYINAMNSDCKFYRVDDKEAPHNSYIKWTEVKNKIDSSGWWGEKQDIRPFSFLSGGQLNEGEAAAELSFKYSAIDYKFTYDAETGKYTRTVFGKEYTDKETGEPITCSNVLVQKVKSSVLDEKGRLQIDMCAGGEAVLFTNGVAVKGTWARENLDSRTIFTDTEGNEFKLTPGNSWVEVVDQNCELSYK